MEQWSSKSFRNPLRIMHIIECLVGVVLVFLIAFEPLLTKWTNWQSEMVHAVVDGFFLVAAQFAISYSLDAPIDGVTAILTAVGASILFIICIVLVALTFKEKVHVLAIVSLVVAILLFFAWLIDLVLHSLYRHRKLHAMKGVPVPTGPPEAQPMVQTIPQAVGIDRPETTSEGPDKPDAASEPRKSVTASTAGKGTGTRRPSRRPGSGSGSVSGSVSRTGQTRPSARGSRVAPRSQDKSTASTRTSTVTAQQKI